jgi:cytidylate kinase
MMESATTPVRIWRQRVDVQYSDDDVCVVAIDGPSGTGKSTVSRHLATAIGARYLDTGAMYRAVTWAVLDAGVATDDAEQVANILGKITLASGTDPQAPHISVDGRSVDAEIRTAEVTGAVSAVASVPAVRLALVARQREIIADAGRIVVEGRDISSVVWPQAELKIYLTASEEERARRRGAENAAGAAVTASDLAATQAALARRDALDKARAQAAGERLDGAIEVDTTGLDIAGVVSVLRSMLSPADAGEAAR